MFKNLTDFGLKRDFKEALIFYIVYLVLFILSGGLIAGLLASFTNSERAFQMGLKITNVLVFVAVFVISFLIVKEKRLLTDIRYVGLILLSGLLAVWGGGILGLIIPAILTTRPKARVKINK